MNWGELKAAVAAYAHRTDLASMLPTFLKLAEQRIYFGENNVPKVRVAAMRQFVTLANGSRPAGFLEAIKVTPSGKPECPLTYRAMDWMPSEMWAYSWDGETLVLSRDQGFPVDLTYYAKLATPSVDSDENWLMANAPGVYLAAILVEVYRWAADEASAGREASVYASAANSLTSNDKATQISGSPLVIKRRGA